MTSVKEIKGFVLSPIISSFIFSLLVTIIGIISSTVNSSSISIYAFLNSSLIWFISALPIVYSVTLIIGIPGYILFKNKNISSLLSYIIGGMVLGIFSPILFLIFTEWAAIKELGLFLFLISAFFGLITSSVFWLIVVKGSNE